MAPPPSRAMTDNNHAIIEAVRSHNWTDQERRARSLKEAAPPLPATSPEWLGDAGSTFLPPKATQPAKPERVEPLNWPGPFTEEMCRQGARVLGENHDLSPEQKSVLDVVLEGTSVFITGCAGTGKSVLARAIVRELRKKYADNEYAVAVTASTGVAARNIGGQTLHSFAGIGLGLAEPWRMVMRIRENHDRMMIVQETQVIVIDEVATLPGQYFQTVAEIWKAVRGGTAPFGDIQIVAIGDFHQLPPVPDPQGRVVFAFQTEAWRMKIQRHICLKTIHRQHDPELIALLNNVRNGTVGEASMRRLAALQRTVVYPDGLAPSEIYPTKAEVLVANEKRLNTLYGPDFVYDAIDDVDTTGPNLASTSALEQLRLKVGTDVLLIQNRYDGTGLVNGSRGKVLAFCTRGMWDEQGERIIEQDPLEVWGDTMLRGVRLDNEDINLPVVEFVVGEGKEHLRLLIEPSCFRVQDGVDGWAERYQIPLIPAYAMTTNRSQGMSLDRIKADFTRAFAKGQAYTTMARAIWAEGLQVVAFVPSLLGPHPAVEEFSRSFECMM